MWWSLAAAVAKISCSGADLAEAASSTPLAINSASWVSIHPPTLEFTQRPLCIPAVELALAVTVSKLSPRRLAPRKVIELVLSEYGLKLTPHAMPGLLSDE